MIVRRLAARRLVKSGSTEEEPRRKRAARFLVIVLTAGLIAGVAAWLPIWPFGNFHALVAEVFGGGGAQQISAETIFPSVKPISKTVDMYPSPAAIHRSRPSSAPTSAPTHPPQPPPSPIPHGSPTPDT